MNKLLKELKKSSIETFEKRRDHSPVFTGLLFSSFLLNLNLYTLMILFLIIFRKIGLELSILEEAFMPIWILTLLAGLLILNKIKIGPEVKKISILRYCVLSIFSLVSSAALFLII
ncbi:hypothetical protein L4D06_02235 [Enterovibrio makurazakiensis]|uniref:hypothetical protein n=1 Tax=Enterovibrio makurazakiensis TaxID=2910232 RepID=UPI003D23DA32